MFGRRRKIKYEIPVPPVDKPIQRLSQAEARQHFEWYMGKLDERTAYLRSVTNLKLDHSPDSLVPLWAWFLKHAQIEDTPAEVLTDLKNQLQIAGNLLIDVILDEHKTRFTLETEYMMWDIAMYLGQVFVKNHPSIFWGVYTGPKGDAFINCPVLMGFPNEIDPEKKGMPFPPLHMVQVQASRILRQSAGKRDLFRIYQIWEDKLRE